MKRYQYDYYKILGLSKSASSQDIKHAYRQLARTHHPDKTNDGGQMTLINEAYAILKDPKKRADYDAVYVIQFGVAGRLADKITQEIFKSPTIMANLQKTKRHAHTLADFAWQQFDKIAPQMLSHAKVFADKLSDLMGDTPTLTITPTLASQGGQFIFYHRGRHIRTNLPQGLTDGSQIKLTIDGQAVWFVLKIKKS